MNWKFWTKKEKEQPEKKKSAVREWWDAILFAVVAATLIRWLIMEAYTIPTPSMENSMLVGDFLFVSKFHYGTRTPRTPIQMPLTHQKIWFTEIPSYADWIQLPSYRLPGFTHVKRNDVVVFNVPRIEENNYGNYNRNTWIDYPVDLKTNYIKRCVAEAGDVLEIRNRQLVVNGTPFENPEGLRFQYLVESTNDINVRNIEKLGLDGDDYSNQGRSNPEKPELVYYTMYLTSAQKELVKSESYIKSVELYEGGEAPRFPFSKYTSNWTGNNYGPLTIPKEGMTIAINDSTLSIYGTTIKDYDGNEDVEIKEGKLTIAGKEVTEYTFNQNYYFMMGDNRDNSLDSRYWGFVPEDHVVGKGFFIWLSIDKYGSFLNKIRWNRFFKPVR
ncbi:MAG TPA: signal peptidase I [Cytophagales bacterium]|nr:signal peptidase I [Cytophagales bacterium]HRG11007.1 signal peptidase I [Cyclobacteriaceae bacterium]